MRWKGKFALGIAAALSSAAAIRAQGTSTIVYPNNQAIVVQEDARPGLSSKIQAVLGTATVQAQATPPIEGRSEANPIYENAPAAAAAPCCGSGPTPLLGVKILEGLIYGENAQCPPIHVAAWADFDYTYRSTGHGQNNIAPVMNRFGDEALVRQLGLYLWRDTKKDELSFGFNMIFIGGADAAFLGPTAGGWANTNPRFGSQFTDLNVTAHLPILTDGGVDVKAGRQTTCLGPMGALPWQRYFTSSDYAWYNLEEGRYTGISTVWHINKRLDWYNGVEVGGWGTFFDNASHGMDYLTQVSYWLDEEAKNTKAWFTVLTGPTSFVDGQHGLNTTVLELGIQHNWSECWYQIVDSQMVWSCAPIFDQITGNYNEQAYDIYTYIGRHMSDKLDMNSRFEWYYDAGAGSGSINGTPGAGDYPGGFGRPHTSYFSVTVGPDYHPVKWLQIRPELRYDYATTGAFGASGTQHNQFSAAIEALFKF